MPVQNDTELVTFQNRVLRIRPAAGKAPRLLALIHGLTGDENSMWVFVRNFPDDYWIVAPRAPYNAEPPEGGYSWQPLPPGSKNEDQRTHTLRDLRPAAEALLSLIDAYAAENDLQASQFDLIGFSQGGALTNTLALLHPDRIRRAAILAGFMPTDADAFLPEQPLKGKPFFVAHGSLDEKVKIRICPQLCRHARKSRSRRSVLRG